ncbi:hypothetical protein ACTXT7_007987 [Hymenolepis weldensis]
MAQFLPTHDTTRLHHSRTRNIYTSDIYCFLQPLATMQPCTSGAAINLCVCQVRGHKVNVNRRTSLRTEIDTPGYYSQDNPFLGALINLP